MCGENKTLTSLQNHNRIEGVFSPTINSSRPFGVIVRFGRPYISNGPKTCVLVALPVYFLSV